MGQGQLERLFNHAFGDHMIGRGTVERILREVGRNMLEHAIRVMRARARFASVCGDKKFGVIRLEVAKQTERKNSVTNGLFTR